MHVTQGTVANRDYRQIIAPTLKALADDDVLVVVSTGGRPIDTLPSLPANARAAESLPYKLLPLTDVYLTNSGNGGVQYALRYGVPVVATSGHEDKPEVAARVVWSGVGRRLNTETPSPAAVRRAVHTVLRHERYRATAQHLANSMTAADGLRQLTEIVDNQITNNAQTQRPLTGGVHRTVGQQTTPPACGSPVGTCGRLLQECDRGIHPGCFIERSFAPLARRCIRRGEEHGGQARGHMIRADSGTSQSVTESTGTVEIPANPPCGVIMTLLILLILIVGGVVAYRYRVPLIAMITGQRESRIRRALDQRKRN